MFLSDMKVVNQKSWYLLSSDESFSYGMDQVQKFRDRKPEMTGQEFDIHNYIT